jgi:hypothetical protein
MALVLPAAADAAPAAHPATAAAMAAPVTGRLETFLFAIVQFPILVQLR